MRVILLSSEYPPYVFGGIGIFVSNLANGLCKEGVKVTVISGYPVPSGSRTVRTEEENDGKVDVVRFPYPNVPPRHTIFQLVNMEKISDTVKNVDADVVHGQSGSTFPASMALRNLAPIVVTFHMSPMMESTIGVYSLLRGRGIGDFWTYGIGYPAWSFVFRRELHDSKIAVSVSRTLKSELVEEMGSACREKMCEIDNGVDIEMLDSEYIQAGDDLQESEDTILFAGRLFWRKGALNIIRIAYLLQKEDPRFRVIVHGTGPLFGKMKREIQELNLRNIELRGFTSRTQLMKSMKKSKFVVIPSFYEACPMILLESMCLGKIPITFNLPYSREFTKNGKYGILAENPKDIVEKIKTAREELNLESFGNELKDYARRKYNIQNTAARYLECYRIALKNNAEYDSIGKVF